MNEQLRNTANLESDPAIAALAAGFPELSDVDRSALSQLRPVHRFVGRSRFLMSEGDQVTHLRVLCKGWAIRSRRLDDERRQILDFVLPGDIIGLHVDAQGNSISDATALTACEVGEIDVDVLDRLANQYGSISRGMKKHLTRQLVQANDQVLRLGRMTAYERLCNFLLDIYARQRGAQRLDGSVDFPITQTVVSDALGLSVVHVNRQVMQLRREGLVTLSRRALLIHDEERLAAVSGYRERGFTAKRPVIMAAE